MKPFPLVVTLFGLLTSISFAQAAKDSAVERTAIEANDRAYEAAFAKADVKALAEFFAEDAEYTADDGRTFTGRAEISEAIRAGLLANKGAKLIISTASAKPLTSEVVTQKGTTTLAGKDGSTNETLFTAIHVKKDGHWKIGQLIESPVPAVSAADRLAELDWLIGEWQETDKTNDFEVRSQFLWARGGNFITRNVTVKRAGEATLEGWQVIGWDPLENRIRSWTFDSEGGFADGVWTREGDRWLLRETGVAPDGSRTSSDNTFTKLTGDRYAWESNNRTLDGDPQPGIGRIEVNRVKGN
jgi:uncharacterized protein (TIGR02246 family)